MKEYFKLLRFVKPQVGLLALAVVCMAMSVLFNGASLSMIVPVVDRVLTGKEIIIPQGVRLPSFLLSFIDKFNALPPWEVLKTVAITMIAVFFLKSLFIFLQSYLMNVVGQRCVMDVRNQIYRKLQALSLDFYGSKRTGELMSRITNDVSFITHAVSYGLTDLIYQTMQIVFFTFVVFFLYWKMALISFVLFPLIILPVVRIGKRIKKFSVETQSRMADLNSILTETIQGVYIVKAFGREEYEAKRFHNINYNYCKYILKSVKRTIVVSPLTEYIGSLGAITILMIAGRDVIAGKLSFGIFGLFMGSLMSMIKPFKKLSNVHAINQQALAASHRIYEILEEEPKIQDSEHSFDIRSLEREIVFENVSFHYGNEDYVLRNIDVTVNKNEVVALVGHSGAGKSTLVSLLPRFYDPQAGRVLIDGRDLKDLKIVSLRSLISVVSQDMVLFNNTIRENIAYGREGAQESDIIDAAKRAFAYDFVQALPDGFDTIVGDRGFRLSGGEKQRLAIARAILKDSPILILDEATSQLDSLSERYIQEALTNLMKGKTVFVIAHRLSTVQKADRIFVLEKGRVVEEGSHNQLIQEGKIYKKLYELQFNV